MSKRKPGRPRGIETESISLRVPAKMLHDLDAAAKRERVTRTALIVRALEAAVRVRDCPPPDPRIPFAR